MFDQTRRPYTKRKPTVEKPLSWLDMDQLGIARDHYYRHYLENKNCGRCGGEKLHIQWHRYSDLRQGWQWRCHHCRQSWMTPCLIPKYTFSNGKNFFYSDQDLELNNIAVRDPDSAGMSTP